MRAKNKRELAVVPAVFRLFANCPRYTLLFGLAFCLLAVAPSVNASSVIRKIIANNPSRTDSQKVEIKSYLPAGTSPQNVINMDGLELSYDIDQGLYYAHKEVELAPNELKTFQVEMQDVWLIPEAAMTDVRSSAKRLVDQLKGTGHLDTAQKLQTKIEADLTDMLNRQNQNTVELVKPDEHIRAYEANAQLLGRVKDDLGRLEDLVIGTGQAPGALLGTAKVVVDEEGASQPPSNAHTAVIQIRVQNPSETQVKTNVVRCSLPPEIKLDDVVDAGGLQTAVASDTKLVYVYSAGIELAPKETRVFSVKIRNRWLINQAKVFALESRTTNLLTVVNQSAAYKPVEEALNAILKDLAGLKQVKESNVVNPEYVAAYREQVKRLTALESKIIRLEQLLKTPERPRNIMDEFKFTVRTPDRKTTWIIIYSVLGFLALFSLLFFLRWYGRSNAEKGPTK